MTLTDQQDVIIIISFKLQVKENTATGSCNIRKVDYQADHNGFQVRE